MAIVVKSTGTVYLRLFSKLEAENKKGFDYPASKRPDGLQNAHLRPGVVYFEGRVLSFTTKAFQTAPDVWVDDVLVSVALPSGEVEEVNVGPLNEHAEFTLDATPEVFSKVETFKNVAMKLEQGLHQAQENVDRLKPALRKGGKALAVKGRKVAIGTEVEIFWSGNRYNKWTQGYDHRLGVVLPNGAKEWVSADNFQPLPTPAEVAAYSAALKVLDAATVASLEGPKDVGDLGNYEEAKLANDEANEDLRRSGRLTHDDLLALMPPRVLVREMVRDAFGDEAVDELEHERLHEVEHQQVVQMEDG